MARLPAAMACAAGGSVAGSMRNGAGLWKLSVKTWSMVREKKSAIGWPGTSMPTASTRMAPLTRGEASRAISAAIHPPTEFPMTVTSSSWPISATYSAARSRMPVRAVNEQTGRASAARLRLGKLVTPEYDGLPGPGPSQRRDAGVSKPTGVVSAG